MNENKDEEEAHKIEWLNIPEYKHEKIMFSCNGFTIPSITLNNLTNINKFKPRKNDVWVVSFPKSGTTWTQELVYLIANDCDFEKAKTGYLPNRSPSIDYSSPDIEFINNMPTNAPRILKTHIPMSLLPSNIENESKVIYVVRNPKDVCVSFYHYAKLRYLIDESHVFSDFLKLFMEGKVPFGPWWKHVDEYANKKDNVHLLHYEDLHQKPYESVKSLGEFLNKSLSEEEINELLKWSSFDNMKKNPNVNYEHYKETGISRKDGDFFRKGKIGDWINYFSKANSQEFDDIINKNLNYKIKLNYGISNEDLQKMN